MGGALVNQVSLYNQALLMTCQSEVVQGSSSHQPSGWAVKRSQWFVSSCCCWELSWDLLLSGNHSMVSKGMLSADGEMWLTLCQVLPISGVKLRTDALICEVPCGPYKFFNQGGALSITLLWLEHWESADTWRNNVLVNFNILFLSFLYI